MPKYAYSFVGYNYMECLPTYSKDFGPQID